MSDVRLPPDALDGDGDSQAQRAGDSGPIVIGLGAPDDGLPNAAPASTSEPQVNGEANEDLPLLPGKGPPVLTLAAEPAFDDFQPMLDLRFPEPAPGPPLTAEPDDDPAGAAPSHQLQPDGSSFETPDRPASASADSPQPLDAAEPNTASDVQPEVSPIFSALDAADKAAEALKQSSPAPEIDAFEIGILLPGLQPVDDVVADSGAEPENEAESPGEVAAGTDAESTAVPSDPDDDTRPAELLQDAASRIAAEASATAAALENLKRLLAHKLPEPMLSATPSMQEAAPEPSEPPAIPVQPPPVHMPVRPPPMIESPLILDEMPFSADGGSVGRSGIAVGSFLAGFALSWVVGAVLYVFLTAG